MAGRPPRCSLRCSFSASFRLASYDAKTWLFNNEDQLIFAGGIRVEEDASPPVIEGHRDRLNTGLLLDQRLDGFGATTAVHAFDLQCDGLHVIAPNPTPLGHFGRQIDFSAWS
jgi:hypothetical protein